MDPVEHFRLELRDRLHVAFKLPEYDFVEDLDFALEAVDLEGREAHHDFPLDGAVVEERVEGVGIDSPVLSVELVLGHAGLRLE